MRQVKILTATNPEVLERDVNEELKKLNVIDGISVVDIKYSYSGPIFTALIEYTQVEKITLFEQDIAETDKVINLKEE